MHILLIHQAFASLDEAGGTRHAELAHFLVQKGYQVTIIASPVSYLSGKPRNQRIPWVEKTVDNSGVIILRTYTYPALHKSFIHRVFSFLSFMVSSFLVGLQVKHVDFVWGTSPPIFQGFTAWLLARLKRVPFLFEVRDLWPAFAIAVGVLKNRLLIRLSLWLERFLYRHADRVMINSPGFIQHVSGHGAKWIELIPNGADPSMFNPSDKGLNFRNQYHLDDKFLIIYAGAHGLSNDLGIVLQTASILRDSPEIGFVLVGDGKEKSNLQAQAANDKLSNVVFVPPVAKQEMAEVLAAGDACLAILKPIDLYKTTFPNKVFDYMASGRAVICAIDGVIRKVIEDSCGGVFVEPGNPKKLAEIVLKLSKDPNQVKEMGLAGRKWIEEKYDRSILAEKLYQLIEDMGRNHA